MKKLVFIKFNEQDKRVLEKNKRYYDGILFDAHILTLSDKGASKILIQTRKDFIIDPGTFFFHPINENIQEKLSISRLAEAYDLPEPENPILEPSSFDRKFRDNFVSKVLDFQEQRLKNSQRLISRYLKGETRPLEPKWYIPPYFPIDSFQDDWIDVNIKLAKKASEIKKKKLLPIMAFLDPDMMISPDIEKITEIASKLPGNNIGIWVLLFDKKAVAADYLEGYAEVVTTLNKKKKVFSFFSTFFDLLLDTFAVSHGVCGGDVKYNEGGGVPPTRIYVPFLKREFSLNYLLPILSNYGSEFGYKKSDKIASKVKKLFQIDQKLSPLKKKAEVKGKNNKKYIRKTNLNEVERKEFEELTKKTTEIKDTIKKEFLMERAKEVRNLSEKGKSKTIQTIRSTTNKIFRKEKSKRLAKLYAGHLKRWSQVL